MYVCKAYRPNVNYPFKGFYVKKTNIKLADHSLDYNKQAGFARAAVVCGYEMIL